MSGTINQNVANNVAVIILVHVALAGKEKSL
jgi:hypothetical protein